MQTYISYLCQLKERRSNGTSVAVSTSSDQILVSNTIFQKKKPVLNEEIIESGLGQGQSRIFLDYLSVP